MEPLAGDQTKVGTKDHKDYFSKSFEKTIENNQIPYLKKFINYSYRINTVFEGLILPSIITFGLIYWPYALCFKMSAILGSGTLFYRVYNKI